MSAQDAAAGLSEHKPSVQHPRRSHSEMPPLPASDSVASGWLENGSRSTERI